MDELQIVYLPPGDLIPYEKNAKLHPPEQVEKIANSIKRFKFRKPIVIDENNVIVAGHGAVLAAKRLGLEKVPCVRTGDLTEAEIDAYRLADNQTNEGEYDTEILKFELDRIADLDLDFSMIEFGFDENITGGGYNPLDVQEDETDLTPPEKPVTILGDIYQLGRHRLMCGDATNIEDAKKLMNGITADIAVTSPPYGESDSAKLRDHYVPGKKKRKSLYNTHGDRSDEWGSLIEGAMSVMRETSKAQFINIQMLADNKRDLVRILSDHAGVLCDIMVWDKTKAPPQMQKNVLNNEYEFIFIFSDDGASRSVPFADFHGNVNNIIRVSTGKNEFSEIHRAVYPIELPAQIMMITSKARTVLDPFGGTGTTMIAAEQLDRVCYMMELDPKYCDVIVRRWEEFTGKKAVRL